MQKRAPTLANILVIVLFALSCFGLLLFLWESFGGPVPLKPKGYRFTVQLTRTLSLAEQSDVRISGVSVGHVIGFSTRSHGLSDVTVEMDHEDAPIRADDQMILRQKTLLGETYIELVPQSGPARNLPDGGRLPSSQVKPAVTLDDILAALEPRVRKSFQLWAQLQAAAYHTRGEQINYDFAEVPPFVEQGNKLLTILASQEGALSAFVRNTGVVFDALTERDDQFRGLIENGERSFHALAQSNKQFAEASRGLPAFEHNSEVALRQLDSLADAGGPLLEQSRAWERELTPLLRNVKAFTPDFNSLLTNLGPFASASKKGLPFVPSTLRHTVPLLENVTPVLRNLDPLLQFASGYIPEVQSFFANLTAATQAHDKNADFGASGPIQHYLRGLISVGPEALAVYNQRIGTNRANPYFQSGALSLLGSGGLQSFSTANCANSAPIVEGPANAAVSETLIKQLTGEVKNAKGVVEHVPPVANKPESTTNEVAAPACTQQSPFTWEGTTSQFPHVTAPAPLK
jgi:phospholipid/cholesterol/gamma-HCH transport system substrate-binding protein